MNVLCCLLASSLTEGPSRTHGFNNSPHGLNIDGVFSHVAVAEFPVQLSFYVALILQAEPPDSGRTCAVASRLVGQEGERVFQTAAPAEVTVPQNMEEPLAPLLAPLLIEPVVSGAGRYLVEVVVDGAVVGRLPLHVSLKPASETDALVHAVN